MKLPQVVLTSKPAEKVTSSWRPWFYDLCFMASAARTSRDQQSAEDPNKEASQGITPQPDLRKARRT